MPWRERCTMFRTYLVNRMTAPRGDIGRISVDRNY